MNYTINNDNKPIIERILSINNINETDLDVSNFNVDEHIEVIDKFKQELIDNKNESFLIVGDYDCDGICATAIMKKLLDSLKIKNNYYIPSRSKQGYGLNNEIVNNAKNNNFTCLICVDNGVVATDSLKLCKEYGIKVFIIDHHEYVEEPECQCLLHANMFETKYADMCAGGLCCLLANSFKYDEFNDLYGGLATLADMVKVFNYNRYLIKKMLEIVKQGNITAINYLLGKNSVNYQSIQFNVIPKINAVSRLDEYMNVNYVVKYLLASDDECLKYFDKIEYINKARKDYSNSMYEKAISQIDINDNIFILADESFKEGLCGLVANRLLSNYGKPNIVFSIINDELKGSGRSSAGFNLYEYLSGCKDLFNNFGGHGQAVGLSISKDNYALFKEYIKKHPIKCEEVTKDVLYLDSDNVNKQLIEDIDSLRPFGTGFIEPLIALNNEYQSKFIISNKYPKFIINNDLSAISFNSDFINKEFDYMIGRVNDDNYRKGKLSFVIEDLI